MENNGPKTDQPITEEPTTGNVAVPSPQPVEIITLRELRRRTAEDHPVYVRLQMAGYPMDGKVARLPDGEWVVWA